MGMADTVMKEYMRENAVFADAFNFFIYGGEQVIDPLRLKELDTTEIALPFSSDGKDGEQGEAVQKYRDVLKSATIMQDDEAAYILMGIENQTSVHYAMPVRNIIYDALQYGRQVAEIAAKHRKSDKDYRGHNKGEYLSGFYKEDRITPVITLVIHFAADKWDGPLSLHDMMTVSNRKLLDYVHDYPIHLVDPAGLSPEDLDRFTTSLREVMSYIKYSKNAGKLTELIHHDLRMKEVEANAARVIQVCTNTPFRISEGAEVINMCEAIEAMITEKKLEGVREGKLEGKLEGRLEGEREGKLKTLAGLVKDGLLSMNDAAVRADMTVEAFEEEMNKFAFADVK